MTKPTHILLCDVFYIDHHEDFSQEAVPVYELPGGVEPGPGEYTGFLYMEEGTEGWYDEAEGHFESDMGSDSRLEKEYVKVI